MAQLGPEFDLAVRVKTLEQLVAKLAANQIGQAFSATQSDGSLGMAMQQSTVGAGATSTVWYQGPNTPRDPNTGQHAPLLYIGQILVGGVFSDNAAIFFYPSGVESMTIGAGGVGLKDAAGNTVVTPDQTAGEGLGAPSMPLPLPVPAVLSAWASTNATSWGTVAYSQPILQNPKLYWAADVLADAGTTGEVRLNINNGQTYGSVHPITSTNTGISDLIALPAGFYGQSQLVSVEAQVTGGTGSVHVQSLSLYGRPS